MTRLTDGKRTVEISMANWDGSQWSPDWSSDFFAVGSLEYNDETEAYCVQNVDYCIDYAMDWKNGRGDFADERIDREEMGMEFSPDDRLVDVEEI